MKIIQRIQSTILFLLVVFQLQGQTVYDTVFISRSEALDDLSQLEKRLENNYKPYDLDNFKSNYLNKLKNTRTDLPSQISLKEFRFIVLDIVGSFKEAHFNVGGTHPFKGKKEIKKENKQNRDIAEILPFDFKLQDDLLRVSYDYRPDSIQVNEIDSIIHIGNKSVKELLGLYSKYRIYEFDDQISKNKFLTTRLNVAARSLLFPAFQDSVLIKYRTNGTQKESWIQYVKKIKKRNFQRLQKIDSLSTAIITLDKFKYALYDTGAKDNFSNLHNVWLDTINKYNPDHLIIDLRNCPGGSAKLCRKWVSGMLEGGKLIYKTNAQGLFGIPFLFLKRFKLGDKPKFKRKTKLKSTPYSGDLYVIINESVFSSGMIFAQAMKRYNRATLIGQPTGQKSYGTHAGYSKSLRLKHSGVRVNIPQIYFKLDDRELNELTMEGVQPDIFLPHDFDVNNNEHYDATMEYVLELIAEKKSRGN